MITVENIAAPYGLSSASFSAQAGELIALVGPNGSGKTTLIKALAGLQSVSGEITRQADIAYLPQTLEFLPTMKVVDVVALGRAPSLGRLGKLSDEDKAIVAGAMHRTCVEHLSHRSVGTLSGGEQARVGLARALAQTAPILLVDEPTASLDMAHALDMLTLLRTEAARGTLVICALHDLALAATGTDRVLMMEQGHLVADGPPSLLSGERLTQVFGIMPPPNGWQTPLRSGV